MSRRDQLRFIGFTVSADISIRNEIFTARISSEKNEGQEKYSVSMSRGSSSVLLEKTIERGNSIPRYSYQVEEMDQEVGLSTFLHSRSE